MRMLTLFLTLCLLSPCLAQTDWSKALGDLSDVREKKRTYFTDESGFLANEEPWGKSVPHYLSHWFRSPSDQRHTIVVRWLGSPDSRIPDKNIKSFLEAFFQLPVRVEVDLGFQLPSENGGKHSSDKIRASLLQSLPEDAFCVIALVKEDLYSEDSGPDRLLFGEGHYYDRTAVASVARLKSSDQRLYTHRVFKLLAHELVHTFSVEHCGFFSCLMNPSGSIEASDQRPIFLCPVCLRKQHSVLVFDLEKRYRQLMISLQHSRMQDATWLKRRLQNLTSAISL